MICKCGGKTHVKETRTTSNGMVWRRRECLICSNCVATVEVQADNMIFASKPSKKLIAIKSIKEDDFIERRAANAKNEPEQINDERRIEARLRIEDMKMQRELDSYDVLYK